ncbi:O-antigen ligase family protein [Legionella lytica]|uniref:O-antigen ligase family protein n=1 Tax=Legionella lytica TaxID=96232 RepID=A0ABW8D639_9GAMM
MKQLCSEEKSVLIAPFFIVLFVFFVPISSSLKSIMAGIALAALLLTPFYRKQVVSAYNSLWGWAGIALFAYVLLGCLWSEAPYHLRFTVVDKYSKALYLPILAVGFIHPKTRRWAFNAYFASMLITCVLSFLKQKGMIALNNPVDTGEVFHNHIVTGFMVALAVYFAAIISLEPQVHKWQRIYCWLMIAVGSYQIFFLNTGRTGYFIYAFLMLFLIVQKFSLKKAALGVTLLVASIGLVYLASPLMQLRTGILISDIKFLKKHEENTSLGYRMQFHKYARSLFEEHPVFGIGSGYFKYSFHRDKPVPGWEEKLNEPHSQYWLALVEGGVVGLMFYLTFIGSLIILAFKQSKTMRLMMLGPLIAVCFGSFSDSIFCYSPVGSILVIVCAMGFAELLEKRATARAAVKEKLYPSSHTAELAV